jgi:hypothetical protein
MRALNKSHKLSYHHKVISFSSYLPASGSSAFLGQDYLPLSASIHLTVMNSSPDSTSCSHNLASSMISPSLYVTKLSESRQFSASTATFRSFVSPAVRCSARRSFVAAATGWSSRKVWPILSSYLNRSQSNTSCNWQ